MADPAVRALLGAFLPEGEASDLADQVERLPDPDSALRALRAFPAAAGGPTDPARLLSFLNLAGFSPYVASLLVQNPEFLNAIPPGGLPRAARTREDLEEDLARFMLLHAGSNPSDVLRRFKKRELLRIVLADLLGFADLPAITRALSLLAEVLLERAVRLARVPLEERFGGPTCRDDQGHVEEATFAILALGKLGGEELNYSSDIDLLYLFSRDGETAGGDRSSGLLTGNRAFFSRLSEDVTRLIAGRGPEGQVFRVDLGLRPGGSDGDITIPLAAAVAYYHNWAEPWERQALIKARPVAGDLALGRRFVGMVEPLVYPSNPDPYLVLDIAQMKDRIDARLGSEERSSADVKLGRGGIRELEFGVQALQLLHGGRDPWLRQGNTLLALHRLADKGLVGYEEYSALSKAYGFLRELEHRLQLGHDRQTATLPGSAEELRLVARRMRMHDRAPGREVGLLDEELLRHRDVVRRFYDSVTGAAAQARLEEEIADPWLDRMDDETLKDRLERSGIADPITAVRPVRLIRKVLQAAATTPEVRRALRKSGPVLLASVGRSVSPRRALTNLEKFFSSLVMEEGDLERFLSHPGAIAPTVRLLGRSDVLAGILIRHPAVLRSLEDRGRIVRTPGQEDYREALLPSLDHPGDARARAAELRRRHQAALATVALRDINRQATLREVLKSQSDLAVATIEAAVGIAASGLSQPGRSASRGLRLAVLGLGRLGYREMDYGSDLDLVFVYESAGRGTEGRALARTWCERIVRILSTLSRDGQLYRVDLRLRPSGGEGELITTRQGLLDYFHSTAETWELQSFLKVRAVAGDAALGARTAVALEREIFRRAAAQGDAALRSAIDDMRGQLLQASQRSGGGGVKLGEGGLLDIHFIIQFLQLRHGVKNPPDKDTLRLLTELHGRGHLSESQFRVLYESYLFVRALDHEMRLTYDRPLEKLPDDASRLAEIGLALEGAPDDPIVRAEWLEKTFREKASAVRGVYEEIIR